MSGDIHEQVHAFADGELPAAEAAAFRLHLGTCARCQAELGDILQLHAHGTTLRESSATGHAPPAPVRRAHAPAWHRRRAALAVALGSALAAALAWAILHLPGTGRSAPIALALAENRSLEARLTWPGASAFRPYGVQRAAGAKPEQVPLKALSALEERNDLHGLATGHLLRGEREQAARDLERAGSSPDLDSDRAVIALSGGALEEALSLLDGVLAKNPKHPQALWNRALVLRNLGLELLAADVFRQVAALGEPGWSEEATQRANALARLYEERARAYLALEQAGTELSTRGTLLPDPAVRDLPGTLRLYFDDALRSAQSADGVRALLPLARAFDRHYGGDTLERAVQEVAGKDFSRRAPLARVYTTLLDRTFDPSGTDEYLARLRREGQDDLLLGALYLTGRHTADLAGFQALANETRDPWFTLFTELEAARAEYGRGELTRAEARLTSAQAACGRTTLRYRCAQLHELQAGVSAAEHRLEEARDHVLAGLKLAREGNEVRLEAQLLQRAAEVARLRNAPALAEAYQQESELEQASWRK